MARRPAANPLARGHPRQPAPLFTALANGKGTRPTRTRAVGDEAQGVYPAYTQQMRRVPLDLLADDRSGLAT